MYDSSGVSAALWRLVARLRRERGDLAGAAQARRNAHAHMAAVLVRSK